MPEATAALPDEATVRDALREVIDPEVGVNIVDMGLIYYIEITPERLRVDMTMTSPACPMGAMIADEVEAALADLAPPFCEPQVRLVWDPPWDPSMMSESSKQHFGW